MASEASAPSVYGIGTHYRDGSNGVTKPFGRVDGTCGYLLAFFFASRPHGVPLYVLSGAMLLCSVGGCVRLGRCRRERPAAMILLIGVDGTEADVKSIFALLSRK